MPIVSRPFDPWKEVVASSQFADLVQGIAGNIEKLERQDGIRQNERGQRERVKVRNLVEAILVDLFVAHHTSSKLCLGVNLNSKWYTANKYRLPYFVTYKRFERVFRYLTDARLGYVIKVKGGHWDSERNKGKNTKIRASKKLISRLKNEAKLKLCHVHSSATDELVRMKDSDKKRITFKKTRDTKRMQENLVKINEVLQRHWIDLRVTNREFQKLQARLIRTSMNEDWDDDEEPPIDFTRRTLYRVFNNCTFEEGGRFYGGWWQTVPSEYRPYLTINEKPTVELDYSGIQPNILYAERGFNCPKDPYEVGLDSIHRPMVKKAFNSLINAVGMQIRRPSEFDPNKVGLSWKDFLKKVQDAHDPIKDAFHTGAGLRLQRKDSDIAEKVLLHFAKLNIPCFPIHDSFIMHHGYKPELEEVMTKAFYEVVKRPISVKVDELTLEQRKEELAHLQEAGFISKEGEATTDFDKLVFGSSPYSAHDKRLDEWWSYKSVSRKITV